MLEMNLAGQLATWRVLSGYMRWTMGVVSMDGRCGDGMMARVVVMAPQYVGNPL